MNRKTMLVGIVVVVVLLGAASLAQAKMMLHVEPLDGDWGGVDDPQVFAGDAYYSGFYGWLDDADDVDAFTLMFDEPVEAMPLDLLVPRCRDHDFIDFYPAVAVIGPGLDRPDDDALAALPFALADDLGAVIITPEPAPEAQQRRSGAWRLFEQGYYRELSHPVDIPQAGEYTFVLWNPDEISGAYTLMTGSVHPTNLSAEEHEAMEAQFALISSGEWLGDACQTGG